MIRVMYLIKNIDTFGGIEKILISKMNWLVNNNFEVLLVTTDQKELPKFPIHDKVKLVDLGVKYYEQKKRSLLKKFFYHFRNKYVHKKRLQKVISQFSPDIIISTFGNEMGIVANLKTPAKKILEFHGTKSIYDKFHNYNGFRGKIDLLMVNKMHSQIGRFDKFIVLSDEEVELWKMDNCEKIPDFLDYNIPEFNEKKSKTVIAVGRLSPEKDFKTMILIWSRIHENHPDWKLKIYGEGDEEKEIRSLIECYNLEDYVTIEGFKTNIKEIYSHGSILLLTSLYEGFSMVLIEAHSYGVPTIAFNCGGGIKEIIVDGYNGFKIENRDLVSFEEKVNEVIGNPTLLNVMQRQAYESSFRYEAARVMPEWENLFSSIINC